MGIDFLDLTLRLERRFGVTVPFTAWEPRYLLGDRGLDLTAWDVAEVVAERLASAAAPPSPPADGGPVVLGYESVSALSRRGRPPPGPFHGADDVWPDVRETIRQTLGCHPLAVRPEARLVSDLGMC